MSTSADLAAIEQAADAGIRKHKLFALKRAKGWSVAEAAGLVGVTPAAVDAMEIERREQFAQHRAEDWPVTEAGELVGIASAAAAIWEIERQADLAYERNPGGMPAPAVLAELRRLVYPAADGQAAA